MEYLEENLLPSLENAFRKQQEKYATSLLANLRVLLLLNTTVLIDVQKKLKIFAEWLDQNGYAHNLARFVEWSQLNNDFV